MRQDRADLDDIVQDAFMQIYTQRDTFKGLSTFKTWASRVAINYCKNYLRRRKTLRRSEEMFVPTSFVGEGDVGDNGGPRFPSPVQSALSTIIGKESFAIAMKTLDRMNDMHVDVITKIDFEGKSYVQGAEELGIPLTTFRTRLCRARKTFRRMFLRVNGPLSE